MNYEESIHYIKELCKFGINLGLERIEKTLDLLGNPDKDFYIIHIAGTNGKGSTAAMIRAGLENSGLRVGLYTSPHIHTYRERIQINKEEISEEDFADMVERVRTVISDNLDEFETNPTEFEFLTAMAAEYFRDQKVDIAIFETGMGGRLDSTNALSSDLSIITKIGFDHKAYLGDTIEEIAGEKAKIIKAEKHVIIGIQEFDEAHSVILKEAEENHNIVWDSENMKFSVLESDRNSQIISWEKSEIKIKLVGEHQVENLMNALNAYRILKDRFGLKPGEYFEGLEKTDWPGRIERFYYHNNEVIIDAAHNPQGAKQLVKFLSKEYADKGIIFLCGILDDKDKSGIMDELSKVGSEFVFAKAMDYRSENWNEFKERAGLDISYIEDVKEAFLEVVKRANKEKLIVSCGSIYLISQIREILIK